MGSFLNKVHRPKYERRHYISIGTMLRETKANEQEIESWNKKFKADNPRYREEQFKVFVHTGINKKSKK